MFLCALSLIAIFLLAKQNRKLRFSRKKFDEFHHDITSTYTAMTLVLDSLKETVLPFEDNDSKKYLSLLRLLNDGMAEIATNVENLKEM